MQKSSLVPRIFVVAAAGLLGLVAIASRPAAAYAGDDPPNCPGTRCTGRSLPLCCSLTYATGGPDSGQLATDYYYFANAI